jgi:elongation factor Ts
VAVALGGRKGVVVEINSETDFVARNADFQKLVKDVAGVALNAGTALDTLSAAAYPDGGTVAEALANAIATVGENMALRRAGSLEVAEGVIGHYVHGAMGEGLGKIGVIVALESKGEEAVLTALGRQIAMHIAASSPLALDPSALDPAAVAREKAVLAEKNAGKPAAVIDRIVESGLKTFYKEVSLLDQSYIHDNAKTVAQAVKDAEKTAGAPIALTGFQRFALGEGVEKPEGPDFATEVSRLV